MASWGVWDVVGMALFLAFTVGYHGAYHVYAHHQPLSTVKGKIHLYRRTWIKRVLEHGNQVLAVQSIRNLIMSSSFMASSALVVIAVVLNFIINADPQDLQNISAPNLVLWKLYLLVLVIAFSFMSFLLNIRFLGQLTVLVGSDPDLIEHVEGMDAVTYLTHILNRASSRFTYGQRGFYFSLPVVAWVFSPVAFVVVTLVIGTFLVGFLDFQRWRPPRALRKQAEELV